ncbi:MAG: sugar kinase [Anaerolineae bacterium]|nr:sugar kinase [Anaerolineae bacterium]
MSRILTLGETMLMLAPPPHELIEHCDQFTAYIGGSEANVAIGLERLGVHAGWIGKLPRTVLGRKVVNAIRAYGVDTGSVVWTDEGRVGLFFVEWGVDPRPTKTIYDREHSAAATLVVDDLDWERIAQAEWLHLTGITPALSATCCQSTLDIVQRARGLGMRVSFDLNYRSLLWSPEAARAAWCAILPHVNLIVAAETDAWLLLGVQGERETVVREIFDRYYPDAVALTCGGDGSVAYDGDRFYQADTYGMRVVNRLGAGDAFDAGLLYGILNADVQTGLEYGNAMAALKMTIPQNIPVIERQDVEHLIAGKREHLVR